MNSDTHEPRSGRWPIGREVLRPKPCEYCGKTFGPKTSYKPAEWRGIRFCSRQCSAYSRRIPLSLRLARAIVNEKTGCLEWQGARSRKGYGEIGDGKYHQAHRAAYALAFGEFELCLHVLHRCDNPCCINPEHLFLGTNYDNVLDRMAKGRSSGARRGHNPNAKLTEAQVREIRADRRTQKLIARAYGISQSTVSSIKRGATW